MLDTGARAHEGEAGANLPAGLLVAGSRPIAPPSHPATWRDLARPGQAVEAPHRLLLTDCPGHDRAWLRIDGGRFAGTEIHLSLNGSHVGVCVLTPHEASRETLAIAMEAVRNRLRARGLTVLEAAPSPRSLQTGRDRGRDQARAVEDPGDEHGRPTF